MTREKLIKNGIEEEFIREVKIGIDEMIESRFQDEREFLLDYVYYHDEFVDKYSLHYWITETDGKRINFLVWLESGEQ